MNTMIHAAIKTVAGSLSKRPLRLVLQIMATCVGTGALALALGVSARLDGFVSQIDRGGRRVAIANASRSDSATTSGQSGIDWQVPPVFSNEEPEALKAASSAIREVSIVNNMNWDRIVADGKSFRVRRVNAADQRYASVMGLDFVAGSFFTADDVAQKNRLVAMSQSSAKLLFGDAASAVGKTIAADRGIRAIRNGVRGGNAAGAGAALVLRSAGFNANTTQSALETFTVVGIYKDPSDFERQNYGIPDMVIPSTTMFPAGFPNINLVRTLVARADTTSLERIAADLRVDVAKRHGNDAKVMVWEGDPSRPQSDSLGRSRLALTDFSALAQALGALILAIACFGIASGIAVEAADRSKEIAIRRSVGLTVFRSAVSFCVDGTVTAAMGGLLGLGAAALFYDSVGKALDPYLAALGINLGSLGGGLPLRAVLAPLAAVFAAFLFSLAPAMRASSGSIADSLKE